MCCIVQQANKWSRQSTQNQRASKRPRHASWERDMIIVGGEELIDIASWYAVNQDIVCGLDVERLLDFGVRRNEQVDQNECGDEQ